MRSQIDSALPSHSESALPAPETTTHECCFGRSHQCAGYLHRTGGVAVLHNLGRGHDHSDCISPMILAANSVSWHTTVAHQRPEVHSRHTCWVLWFSGRFDPVHSALAMQWTCRFIGEGVAPTFLTPTLSTMAWCRTSASPSTIEAKRSAASANPPTQRWDRHGYLETCMSPLPADRDPVRN